MDRELERDREERDTYRDRDNEIERGESDRV